MMNIDQLKLKWIIALLGAFLFVWIITGLHLVFDAHATRQSEEYIQIEILEGATLSQIADQLHRLEIIEDPLRFKLAARLLRRTRSIYPGYYQVPRYLSNSEALDHLSNARAKEVQITLPEGLRSDEIIGILSTKLQLDSLVLTDLLSDIDLLMLAGHDFIHLEGTLFPDTYRFLLNSSEKTIMKRLVQQFSDTFSPEWEGRAREMGFTVPDIITLASLIEKETALAEERRIISSVYHNRIKLDMHLNCDPTLIYMLIQMGQWDGDLKVEHKTIRNRYNTYWFRGLPPGPIANPGVASIEAALYPDSTDYLYFVGKNDGTGAHDFSVTQREHINKVNRYQRRRTAWR